MLENEKVTVKWVWNQCNFSNTAMPESKYALLACPFLDNKWIVAFNNRSTRSIVESCFPDEAIGEVDRIYNGRTTRVINLPTDTAEEGCEDWQVFIDILSEGLKHIGLSLEHPGRPPWTLPVEEYSSLSERFSETG